MRETITIQVGQCGNQIGNYFWNLLLQEQELYINESKTNSPYSEAFFHYSSTSRQGRDYDKNDLRARALLIDMECVSPLVEFKLLDDMLSCLGTSARNYEEQSWIFV